jgi:3-hydroxybutyryl-CoA dehydratase
MSGPMAVGQSATLERTLSLADVQALIALTGEPGLSLAQAGEMLVLALWSTLLGVDLPGPGTNYLKQEVQFAGPVPLVGVLRARVEITRLRLDKGLVDLATSCHGPDGALIAQGRALVQARDTGRLPEH